MGRSGQHGVTLKEFRMATKAVQRITAWSLSRFNTYEQCPALAKYKFIDKRSEPSAPAMERGGAIHKLAESFVRDKQEILPDELALFTEEFAEMQQAKCEVELQLCFNKHWQQIDWFSQAAYCRIKIDAIIFDETMTTARVIDHKTGKFKVSDGYMLQLDLYALGTFLAYPTIQIVKPALWYLDAGEIFPPANEAITYRREQVSDLKASWDDRVTPMLSDTTFAALPNSGCRWCNFSKNKGGPCEY